MTSLPLLVGQEGFSSTPIAQDTRLGTVVVMDAAKERDGLLVQRSMCGCSGRGCGEWADVDTRLLNDPSHFRRGECPFQGRPFFPPFGTVMAMVRRLRIANDAEYRSAHNRDKLPKYSPRDPREYA